jgi:hypothetical protein
MNYTFDRLVNRTKGGGPQCLQHLSYICSNIKMVISTCEAMVGHTSSYAPKIAAGYICISLRVRAMDG